jgi:predicted RNA-binding protein YlxR (DUF448 family)
MARSTKKTAARAESARGERHGKIKQEENKQLDVKSAVAQREEVKVADKSAKVGAAAVRQCAVTRERKSESELLRFVLDGQGNVTPDIKRRLPGRGVWVTANRDVVAEAARRGVLLRSLKAGEVSQRQAGRSRGGGLGRAAGTGDGASVQGVPAGEPGDLPAVVEKLLRQSALSALSMANKAGQLTLGFEAIARALASGGVVGLAHASDAAEDGRRKLDRMFVKSVGERDRDDEVLDGPSGPRREESVGPVVGIFSCEELSSALGRTNVVHAALRKGGASAGFLKEAQRLSSYLEPAPARPSRRRLKQDKV